VDAAPPARGPHLDERVRGARALALLLRDGRLQVADLLVQELARLPALLVVLVLVLVLALVVLLVLVLLLVVAEREVELGRELLVDLVVALLVVLAVVRALAVVHGRRGRRGVACLGARRARCPRAVVAEVFALDKL
jgi:hypothetical protein